MGRPSVPLSAELHPLIMGTATFNSQYNRDPYTLPTTELVHRALSSGIRAFDTSPYYGPAEELLGRALATDFVHSKFPRHTYRILTKVGRVAGSSFDYSPEWIQYSIRRSLRRLHTDYLDLVYCHDVEFVSPAEVLRAVRELRRIRDSVGSVRYIGISGYPVDTLCEVAELVLRETGEPLDAVMSYANFTLQNTRLLSQGLPRLLAAGVDVIPNASPLGMGLLRRAGVPVGSMGDFHPAPDGLRSAMHAVGKWADEQGEKLEVIAIRFALEAWLHDGAKAGALGPPLARSADADPGLLSVANMGTGERLGVSVMGVSNIEELNETLRVWRSIIDALENRDDDDNVAADGQQRNEQAILTPSEGLITDHVWSRKRRSHILTLFRNIQSILGPEWVDYAWPSPAPGFANSLPANHVAMMKREEELRGDGDGQVNSNVDSGASMITPPLEAVDQPLNPPYESL
ncbi:L-galactose dehydrogenase [Aspergillus sclerotialis]|uniref:L-galactose dehydrogenase n=1 Tax=Aspergillus sclerotialis TaxID=2070753 RepID=A0A3A3A6M9_9EURO|nr:L-galactose dehydrogenase [Aspergillus sclerotialis]